MKTLFVTAVAVLLSVNLFAQNSDKPLIGAYYFDGWAGAPGQRNITDKMVKDFKERKSIWGWKTSNAQAMKEQIDLAADAGLSFFDFCWYDPETMKGNFQESPYNQALSLFLQAPNKDRLKYCIIVCNHAKYTIDRDDWYKLTNYWIELFKTDQYLKFNGKPYIVFFSVAKLIEKFGSAQTVKDSLNVFRDRAERAGFRGLTIAGCASANQQEIANIEDCGIDVVTAYSYHDNGFSGSNPTPVDNLINADHRIWGNVINAVNKPYVPAASVNFDRRPQARDENDFATIKYYNGFNQASVYKTVSTLKSWIIHNSRRTYENMGVIYAWNEYGEGAWLTPSEGQNESLLDGVKKALQ
ncbi:MAG TPA: glycoside hydrolase family 99-like domain-containing protein [Mucilaginibacter sp.]|jgi:hypothetical protein|nr:glycoside hydrolase family 99-like domain-containing protein [Mucilaginibacter sp.]